MKITKRKKLRIGLFSDYFSDEESFGGGVGTVVASLAREFSKRGHIVYIFTTSNSFKEKSKKYKNCIVFKYSSIIRAWGSNLSIALLVKPLKYHIDIVHVQGGIVSLLSGLLYSVIKRKPLIITIHQMENSWKVFKDPIKRLLVLIIDELIFPLILKRANKIIVLSKYLLLQSKTLRNFIEKTIIIPNGINVDSYSTFIGISKEDAREKLGLPIDYKIILFVGTICKRKGVHVLLNAATIVIKSYPKCLFIFIGPLSEESKQFIRLINKNDSLKKRIIFTGYVSEFTKKLYYRAADIFVLPSLIDAFPMVLLEASINGLPLIVSDLDAFKAIVRRGLNGFMTRRGDYVDLANKLVYILKNDAIRDFLGKNAERIARTFSWNKIAEKTLNVYNIVTSYYDQC